MLTMKATTEKNIFSRSFGDLDKNGTERTIWSWYYNTSLRAVTCKQPEMVKSGCVIQHTGARALGGHVGAQTSI